MLKKTLLFLITLQFATALSQEKTLKATPIAMYKFEADSLVGYDSLGNLYYIQNEVLFKKQKEMLWHYKNSTLAKIKRVDLQNPLQIVLFYENFNTIILLDNQLNETMKINFSENTIPLQVAATGIATQNRLWIYNGLTQQIGLFDYLKNTFQAITSSIPGNLKWYGSNFNTFQWIDDTLTVYNCSAFGKVTSLGKIPDFEQVQITRDKEILYLKDKTLHLLNFQKNFDYTIEGIEKSFKNFYYRDQILSIFTDQEITNYQITIP
jgi:hypothetical protein